MNKIGLVTVTYVNNFGSHLQSFALQYILKWEYFCDVCELCFGWLENLLPNYKSEEIIHKYVEISDFDFKNIIQYFGECLNFIKGEEKVFVHCMAGASRSATIVIAYLMWIKKMKFDEALNFVISKRPIVDPNDGFREQLKIFEKLLEKNNYDIDKINFSEIKWEPTPFFNDDDDPILLHLDN